MEKFRSSADPSTGIHPFLPPPPTKSILSTVLRLPLTPIRLACALIIFPIYLLLRTLTSPFPRPLVRAVDSLCLPILLLSLSVIPRQPILERPRVRNAVPGRRPGRGDVVFVNHCTPLDVLYLSYAFSPVFSVACDGGLVPMSFLQALSHVGCAPPSKKSTDKLSEIITKSAPLVIFAEGCTTNARGVLQFQVNAEAVPSDTSVYALGLSYSPSRKEAYTLGSLLIYYLRIMGELSCTINARMAAVPSGGDLQSTVASMAAAPPLRIAAEAGVRFLEHWQQTQSAIL